MATGWPARLQLREMAGTYLYLLGAFVASMYGNAVQVVVDASDARAEAVAAVFAHRVPSGERAGLPDRLRRYNNVVTLWRAHPSLGELRLVVSCFA